MGRHSKPDPNPADSELLDMMAVPTGYPADVQQTGGPDPADIKMFDELPPATPRDVTVEEMLDGLRRSRRNRD